MHACNAIGTPPLRIIHLYALLIKFDQGNMSGSDSVQVTFSIELAYTSKTANRKRAYAEMHWCFERFCTIHDPHGHLYLFQSSSVQSALAIRLQPTLECSVDVRSGDGDGGSNAQHRTISAVLLHEASEQPALIQDQITGSDVGHDGYKMTA